MRAGARTQRRGRGTDGVARRRFAYRRSPAAFARFLLGPAVRRARRELQWRAPGLDFRVRPAPAERFPHAVARHATPLIRTLPGLDLRLQRNKVVNLRLAVSRLDGLVIEPGRRLSFWRQVGKPTYRRGFLDGMVLDHGRVAAGVGGGLCQLTNLAYWMTLHTPLTVTERWRHSYDVFPDADRTQPFGSGATCAWPALDLQIENRTQFPWRLGLCVTATHLEGGWTCAEPFLGRYEVYEGEHRFSQGGPGTYLRHNVLCRREFDACGTLVTDVMVAENHALLMYQPFLPAPPDPAPTGAPDEDHPGAHDGSRR
ncbi:MAG: VanW family protein [Actinobacteria bacterium]|nr:VanW family protein [Actinomycetota bacterium]